MDNLAIARVLTEIGDLLEIKGENPFKIRAYRNAADTIVHEPGRVAGMTAAERLALPGVGRDLAAKIGELVDTGAIRYHQELLQEFPPTVLDLLHLQGVGPKTVARLYGDLGVRTLEDLERAARDGRIRGLKGMGAKKEALILEALEERRRFSGRRLMVEAHDTAAALVSALRAHTPDAAIVPVGSLRRGCETCGDIDILAAVPRSAIETAADGATPPLMDAFTEYRQVERVLAHGDTKSSVRLWGGFQADLRLVPDDSLGAALQYFTGSKAHNIALRDRAIQRGYKLNEYGLYRVEDNARIAGEDEAGIYAALGLAWVPPELRENRGEIEAAANGSLPRLLQLEDLQGDLHAHTTATDGRDTIEAMARAAQAAGLRYLAITDHSQSLAMANGLDERRALEHARAIREVNARLDGFTLLAGIECDIRADGSMDLADDCLAQLDIVIASIHSGFNQDGAAMTDRLLRAIACPWVDVLGHPTGRIILKREPHKADMTRVIAAAAAAGVAMEINGQIDRLDLDDVHARQAREAGVKLVVSTDAHSTTALGGLRWAVTVARRAWITPADVLNTRPADDLRGSLRRGR
ncbi:MAG TPA: DNA polymerase/3'-5' exonuclease PolX [Vicinamibacterales bacterium]|nr:DNA polymerase/3'-5' exonuclease PolX [Vicinamibacterales bacterium]